MKRYFKIFLTLAIVTVIFQSFHQHVLSNETDKNMESTVLVLLQGLGSGSGFVISEYHVVTNHHVIDQVAESDGLYVILGPDEALAASVVWSSPIKDLAILETDTVINRPKVNFTQSEDIQVTDTVYVMGFPGAAVDDRLIDESAATTVKVSKGIISAKVYSKDRVALFQTDAPINPGNSGGPLFSEYGTLVGINSSASLVASIIYNEEGEQIIDRVRYGDNIGWAIQADELLVELDALGIPYQLVDRQETSSTSGGSMNLTILILVIIAVLLAAGALLLSVTKKGRVVVKEVSRKMIPGSVKLPPSHSQQEIALNQVYKPYLIGIKGEYAGQKFPINQPIIIGRNGEVSQLVISANEVSSKHCIIRYDSSQQLFYLTDTASTNGTYLENGQRIPPNHDQVLKSLQKFYIANPLHLFEVRLEVTS